MNDVVIQAEGLSKSYRIGHARHARTFREAAVEALAGPWRRMRSIAKGGPGGNGGEKLFWALQDVSFKVKRGEVLGIVGRNGAGKSTLLKILSRITEPTRGRVRLRGRVASLLEVGTGFHPELTGRENIYLNGAVLGMKRAEISRKFDEMVAFAEVEAFLDTPVKRFSSGMYVRLAFAVAAHLEPEILIVDEVLAVGDAAFQKKCLGKMQDVARGEGRTVLFVSHNMAAVGALCSRGLLLENGALALEGATEDVIARYQARPAHGVADEGMLRGGDFELQAFSASHPNGGPLRTFDRCRFEVRLRSERACQLGVHVFIEDASGNLVSGVDSRDFNDRLAVEAGKTVGCLLDVERLPLNAGEFRVRLIIRNDSEFKAWEVPRTFAMDVEGSGVYGVRQVERRWHGTTAMAATVRTV